MKDHLNKETLHAFGPEKTINSDQPRILLIEDDRVVQFIHKKMLIQLGCFVDIANNANEALNMIDNSYDLILLDIGLPDIYGIDLAKEIHRREKVHKRTPIVVLTAHMEESIKSECFRASGIEEVLFKPISLERLKEVIFTRIPRR